MKFIYSLNRKHDGRSLSSFLSLGDHLKAIWEMSWPERKKQFGVIALFRLRLNPCANQMKRFIRFDGSINQISLQIWLRKWPIRTAFVELRCIYKHSSTYFQPFNQRYIAGFSKNKVGKEHLRFNCEGDITLRFPTGFTGSVWKWKGQSAYVRLGEFRSQS